MALLEREPVATGESRKLRPKYRGPYIVAEKLPHDRYKVQDLPETQRSQCFYNGIAAVNKMKRFDLSTTTSRRARNAKKRRKMLLEVLRLISGTYSDKIPTGGGDLNRKTNRKLVVGLRPRLLPDRSCYTVPGGSPSPKTARASEAIALAPGEEHSFRDGEPDAPLCGRLILMYSLI
ncbi:hypothetical protein HPB47_013570 [Ixodes persulcatus]|uniref:Uncharacterized protein n=1 Tax=Ixodes persulcatus TaxID=34615 RepID=A0AC60QZ27_IXOPE|nr:hypothetical protein HPB47_013570 [Ixodes persulcatus]